MIRKTHPKNFISPFNCYNLAIREVSLIEIFFYNLLA
jgi:hypothetical protein